MSQEWDAIVLAGGRSSRLGGLDKSALVFDGTTLLDRALAAVGRARRVVVVGPNGLRERLPDQVGLVAEHPRFGGPAAATAAGVAALRPDCAPRIALLAADLLYAAEALHELFAVGRLSAHVDGVVAADPRSRAQPLLALYTSVALGRATARDLQGVSMRSLTSGMVLCSLRLPERLCADIDTPIAAERHGIALETPAGRV